MIKVSDVLKEIRTVLFLLSSTQAEATLLHRYKKKKRCFQFVFAHLTDIVLSPKADATESLVTSVKANFSGYGFNETIIENNGKKR